MTEIIDVEYQGIPFNFQDFPEDFIEGMMTWDLDIIDIEDVPDTVTGEGVYVAVLDTGLMANWKNFFPEERIKTEWGRGFVDKGVKKDEKTGEFVSNVVESKDFLGAHPHGTHVTSTIIGYNIRGTPVRGVAPQATIIPVKVLEYYPGLKATFGTSEAVAAGIDYITRLAFAHPESRFVISMSLGAAGEEITDVEKDAIDSAIAAGVVVVASAGNEGTDGMGSPGSYWPVISVGSSGWAFTWTPEVGYSGEWIVGNQTYASLSGGFWTTDVPEANAQVSYISDFSSRERDFGWVQELDLVAPGSWVVGPYPQGNGLPWWSKGNPKWGQGHDYYFVGGTSMACPHVSGVAALMLQVNPTLMQADVEARLKSSTDIIPDEGWHSVADPDYGVITVEWGYDGFDAVGAGLLQADAAVAAAYP